MKKSEYTMFSGVKKVASGSMADVILAARERKNIKNSDSILIFNNILGRQVDVCTDGTEEEILARMEQVVDQGIKQKGPGRPKLGVVSREIGLLPRHWDWLGIQPQGASAILRRLVESAIKSDKTNIKARESRDSTHTFMTMIAGNLPNYEEVLRVLYQANKLKFLELIDDWPKDIKEHVIGLSEATFE